MAHEILAAKLCEMDMRIAGLRSQIRLSEQLSDERLEEEITALKIEIHDQAEQIQHSLQQSKAEMSSSLLTEFDVLKNDFMQIMQNLNAEMNSVTDPDRRAEKKILTAEYYIDFAVWIAKDALLKALEAIQAERERTNS